MHVSTQKCELCKNARIDTEAGSVKMHELMLIRLQGKMSHCNVSLCATDFKL